MKQERIFIYKKTLWIRTIKEVEPMDVPILFLVFNRPDTTQRVLKELRKIKPKKIYIAGDGPREKNKEDSTLCAKVRKVLKGINWKCEIQTLFREENQGCRKAVSSAIDWFFENEEYGIILEDDCLPSYSFFRFCKELLQFYKTDERVMVISGNNFLNGNIPVERSYYFSCYNHCWGWATWKRAWQYYDHNMELWPEFKRNNGLLYWSAGSNSFVRYWEKRFSDVFDGKIDTWDYIWTFSCWSQGGLTCIPNVNLVQNIGFDERATHTKKLIPGRSVLSEKMDFPLKHPKVIIRNIEADRYANRHHFRIRFLPYTFF